MAVRQRPKTNGIIDGQMSIERIRTGCGPFELAVPFVTIVGVVVVFGDGCGTAAGAGLIDEVVDGWARGDTAAPEFTFLPRALWNWHKHRYTKINKLINHALALIYMPAQTPASIHM